MSALTEKITALFLEKINFANDEAEQVVEAITVSANQLDAAVDNFELVASGTDNENLASGLVDLADVFDDAKLTSAQAEKMRAAVAKIIPNGDGNVQELAFALFERTLEYGVAAKEANDFFDELLKTEPPVEE